MKGLADISDCLQSGDPEVLIRWVTHEAQKEPDNIHPLPVGQLYRCNGGHDLSGNGANLDCRRGQSHDGILLDFGLGAIVEGEPTVGVVSLPRKFLGTKAVGLFVCGACRERSQEYIRVLIGYS